jgi:hypothetical protein
MRKIITSLLLTLSVYCAFSQDVITYTNGKTQKVVVLTTNDNDITCQDFETKEQFTISRTFLSDIKYQKGKAEPFGVLLSKPEKKVQIASLTTNNSAIINPTYAPTVYKAFIDVGYAGSLTEGVGGKFLLTTSHGLLLNNKIFAGAFSGLAYDGKKEAVSIPVGLDIKVKIGTEYSTFWVGGRAGTFTKISGEFDTGFFYHPNLSFGSKISKKNDLVFSLGYLGQQVTLLSFINGFVPVYTKTAAGYATVSVGISF